jgi:hypothetical protein
MVVPPVRGEAEGEDSAVIAEVAVHVRGAFPGDHRFQRRRLQACDQPLRHRVVGNPVRADATVAPGLLRRPLDGVVEVARLRRRPGIGSARGFSGAAPVDANCGVSARHPPKRVHRLPVHVGVRRLLQIVGRDPQFVFLVGAQIDDDRKAPCRFRAEYVGLQTRPVAHRNLKILLDDELEARLRCASACF